MDMLERARNLRKFSTEIEKKLWHSLRGRRFEDYKFRRQYSIGNYIVDFVCLEKKLIIELDGAQHMQQEKYDMARTSYLELCGFKVIRFWNNEVSKNFHAVLESIYLELMRDV